ncbi:MAG: hypothetical protein HYV63_06220 [Candidatus Schekmanbacteria bacterium]|nr:hypothetical protein [Candidatus Schekmanbacteria bacterium]
MPALKAQGSRRRRVVAVGVAMAVVALTVVLVMWLRARAPVAADGGAAVSATVGAGGQLAAGKRTYAGKAGQAGQVADPAAQVPDPAAQVPGAGAQVPSPAAAPTPGGGGSRPLIELELPAFGEYQTAGPMYPAFVIQGKVNLSEPWWVEECICNTKESEQCGDVIEGDSLRSILDLLNEGVADDVASYCGGKYPVASAEVEREVSRRKGNPKGMEKLGWLRGLPEKVERSGTDRFGTTKLFAGWPLDVVYRHAFLLYTEESAARGGAVAVAYAGPFRRSPLLPDGSEPLAGCCGGFAAQLSDEEDAFLRLSVVGGGKGVYLADWESDGTIDARYLERELLAQKRGGPYHHYDRPGFYMATIFDCGIEEAPRPLEQCGASPIMVTVDPLGRCKRDERGLPLAADEQEDSRCPLSPDHGK